MTFNLNPTKVSKTDPTKPLKPPGSVGVAKFVRPVTQKSSYSPAVKFPRTREASLKSIERIFNASTRVGKLKVGAKKEQVRGHTRRTKGGKIIIVRPHSRKGDEPKAKEIKRVRITKATLSRQQRDLELWTVWMDGGKQPKDLRPLLKQFRGMMRNKASVYVGKVPIPPEAIYAEYTKQFIKALERFDPKRGVGLGTFVHAYLDAAKRFITSNQNVGKIPEPRVHRIGDYKRAHADLDDVLGHQPTPKELSDYLGWKLKDVVLLQQEMRRGLVRSEFEEDPTVVTSTKAEEALRLFRHHLAGTERDVYDYLMGFGNRKQTNSTGEIARALGLSMSKVSRLRKSLAAKVEKYLD
jgi:DNA-directed RNA polymerase specialized sigma subunit